MYPTSVVIACFMSTHTMGSDSNFVDIFFSSSKKDLIVPFFRLQSVCRAVIRLHSEEGWERVSARRW